MRIVVQRVSEAQVRIGPSLNAAVGLGLLVLVGVGLGDAESDAEWLAEKVAHLRIFPDDAGAMNRSLLDVGGAALVVSQFTLYGDARRGRRPSFAAAAPPEEAKRMYLFFAERLRARGVAVETGVFRAMMDVALVNQGPVTLLLDSRKGF